MDLDDIAVSIDTTDYEVFAERDQNELDFGIGNVISLSDKLIINIYNSFIYLIKNRELCWNFQMKQLWQI